MNWSQTPYLLPLCRWRGEGREFRNEVESGKKRGVETRSFKIKFISHCTALISLVINQIFLSPSGVCFACDSHWWLISPYPYLDPQDFCIFSSPHCSWGEQWASLLGIWSPTKVNTHISLLCDMTTVIWLCSFLTVPSHVTIEISFLSLVLSVLSLVMLLGILILTFTYSPTQSNHWHLVYLKIKSNPLEFNLLQPREFPMTFCSHTL